MLSSHHAVRHQTLRSSSARSHLSISSGTRSPPHPASMTCLLLVHHDFSLAAKHKIAHKHPGKVFREFSTHDTARAPKQNDRSALGGYRYGAVLRPYLPLKELRTLSSWGKSGSTCVKEDKSPKTEEKDTADWYTRYQHQKKRQYDEFMKRMEEDPVGMLFGSRWTKWVDDAEANLSHKFQSIIEAADSKPESEKTVRTWGHEPSKSSRKPHEDKAGIDEEQKFRNISLETLDQGYEIDPITNRRVQKGAATLTKSIGSMTSPTEKQSPTASSRLKDSVRDPESSFQVPIKRFVPSKASSSNSVTPQTNVKSSGPIKGNTVGHEPRSPADWLVQEGFGRKHDVCKGVKIHPSLDTREAQPKPANSKIESALDRHLQRKATSSRDSSQTKLQYRDKENAIEDVDLLRASDVRASAGLRGRPAKESDREKQARQRRLEEEYDSRPLHRDSQLAQEVARQANPQALPEEKDVERKQRPGTPSDTQPSLAHHGQDHNCLQPRLMPKTGETGKGALSAGNSEKANRIQSQIVPLKARLDTMKADYDALRWRWLKEKRAQEERDAKRLRSIHEAEVKAQKLAMEAIESRRGPDTSKGSSTEKGDGDKLTQDERRLKSYIPGEGDMASNVHEFANRDRWYKKKAPHAGAEMDAQMQRLANDRALIREVRNIYEDSYGTIDTTHRQPGLDAGAQVSSAAKVSSQSSENAGLSNPMEQVNNACRHTPVTQAEPLAVIQRLFDVLREAQGVVQERRRSLEQLSQSSEVQVHSTSESSDTSAIIQKLFNELRQAQSFIQSQRGNPKEIDGKESATIVQGSETQNQSSKASTDSVLNARRNSQDLSSPKTNGRSAASGGAGAQDSAIKPFTNQYYILAFDPAQQKVVASKPTSLAPFSEEKPLLLFEALGMLKNPGKFLPEVMPLHNKGFTIVSGTSNALVLKKLVTEQELEEKGGKIDPNEVNPVDLMGSEHYRFSASNPILIDENVPPTPKEQKPSETKTSAKSTTSSTYPSESAAPETTSPSPSESNLPPSETVRRKEAVFSGPSRGTWREGRSKHHNKKYKRAGGRSRRLRSMLLTGTVTAACCYAVGVVSQMLKDQ